MISHRQEWAKLTADRSESIVEPRPVIVGAPTGDPTSLNGTLKIVASRGKPSLMRRMGRFLAEEAYREHKA